MGVYNVSLSNGDNFYDGRDNGIFTPDYHIRGNGGNDTLLGDRKDDTLEGGTGNDRLTGEEGNDILKAGTGQDTLIGSSGNDYLKSEMDGNIDYLYGNSGADTFDVHGTSDYLWHNQRWNYHGTGVNIDVVKDFNPSQDFIQTRESWYSYTWSNAGGGDSFLYVNGYKLALFEGLDISETNLVDFV